jgi:quercetin dioxygenase-like cupin family protein
MVSRRPGPIMKRCLPRTKPGAADGSSALPKGRVASILSRHRARHTRRRAGPRCRRFVTGASAAARQGEGDIVKDRTPSNLAIAGREIVAEGADLRVSILTLAAGERVSWHYHSEITDDIVCMAGTTVVETRAPRATHVLELGQRCTVGPKVAHCVHGKDDGPCRYLIVQGVGVYDFMPVGGGSAEEATGRRGTRAAGP